MSPGVGGFQQTELWSTRCSIGPKKRCLKEKKIAEKKHSKLEFQGRK